jgi:Icc-related predicted phosphoesterase
VSGKTLILVTHQPAWNTKLDTASDRHTGSRAIRGFIETHQPVLAVSGHMHEAYGTDRIGPTTLVNPGPWRNSRYAVADLSLPARVELKSLR